ncbi:jg22727 [Pararge aegeria aegeria]|uniref:Jg22727 protein n=1 Tax=Pararge aegeria aegeria TaxID=348720 RepID=A0A8S4QY85_9NEOP|nr:jg22727 [Pararge aegeria aegeria]
MACGTGDSALTGPITIYVKIIVHDHIEKRITNFAFRFQPPPVVEFEYHFHPERRDKEIIISTTIRLKSTAGHRSFVVGRSKSTILVRLCPAAPRDSFDAVCSPHWGTTNNAFTGADHSITL